MGTATPIDRRQEAIDTFYMRNGPCCAGCDWWHHFNSVAGECRRSAPVPANQRFGMLRMSEISWRRHDPSAGHIMTPRDHHCGEFKDEFNWFSLGRDYLCRIGYTSKGT